MASFFRGRGRSKWGDGWSGRWVEWGGACDLPTGYLGSQWGPGGKKPLSRRQEALSAAFWVLEAFGSLTFGSLAPSSAGSSWPLCPSCPLPACLEAWQSSLQGLLSCSPDLQCKPPSLACQPADEDAENRNALLKVTQSRM